MRIGLFLIISLCFLACNNETKDDSLFEQGSQKKDDVVEQCTCEELIESEKGFTLKEELFTGVCLQYNQKTGEKMIEKHFLDGVLNGDIVYFKNNGEVLYKERYEQGGLVQNLKNESVECNCKELKRVKEESRYKYYYHDQLYTGTCSDLYRNSDQKYMESNYMDGYLEGLSTFYTIDGEILYLEKYENGLLIKTIYP